MNQQIFNEYNYCTYAASNARARCTCIRGPCKRAVLLCACIEGALFALAVCHQIHDDKIAHNIKLVVPTSRPLIEDIHSLALIPALEAARCRGVGLLSYFISHRLASCRFSAGIKRLTLAQHWLYYCSQTLLQILQGSNWNRSHRSLVQPCTWAFCF